GLDGIGLARCRLPGGGRASLIRNQDRPARTCRGGEHLLDPSGQIAGRAGRHIRDGTFGVTAECPVFDEDIVSAIENHQFEPVKALMWRSETIDFSSLPALQRSLQKPPPRDYFVRSRRQDDEDALNRLAAQEDIREIAKGGAALATLWDVCQIPDFRKTGGDQHARLLGDIYERLMRDGRLADSWLQPRIERLDRIDGDIDALSARIAHVRTWTYLSHRISWIDRAPYWQERARAIEDRLSDALHEKLTQRFVDRRTAALLKRLKDDAPLLAGVTDDGEVIVEGQFIGRLLGFEFIVDPRASGAEAKSLRAAGEKALRPVLAARAGALANADADELRLDEDGTVWWRAAPVGRLQKGPAPLRPALAISGLADVTPNLRGRVEDRLKDFVAAKIEGLLGPLVALQTAANSEAEDGLKGLTKGVAYRLVENFGATSRTQFGDDLKQIDQQERGKLRKLGVRFGEFTLFMPALLKPAPAALLTQLWALWTDRRPADIPPPAAGRVSTVMSENLPHAYYYASGYRPSGVRAVRIDMLERLAGLIRTARNDGNPREGFEATSQMMSLVGCSGEDFEAILRSLGFRKNVVKRKVEKLPEEKPAADAAPDAATDGAADPTTGAAETPASPPAETPPAEMQHQHAAIPADTADAVAPSSDSSAQSDPAPTPVAVNAAPTAEPAQEANADSDTQAATAPVGTPASGDTSSGDVKAAVEAAPAAEAEEIEVTLWRPAPRRPKPQAKPGARRDDNRGPKGKARGADKHGKPGQHKQGYNKRGKGPRKPAVYSAGPRKPKKADPNSPFAVLAGLKAELSGAPPKPKSKETGKAE
ncbi:MAG: helicase, partial [Pseudomonadota bacterium]